MPSFAAIEDLQCVSDALGNPNGNFCTANDVRITEFIDVDGPESCSPGEEYTVTVIAEIESGPGRYDMGLWFDQSGTGAKTPGALCTREILSPLAGDAASCDSGDTGGFGPFFNADADACGDTSTSTAQCAGRVTRPCSEGGGTCNVVRREVEITTICVDNDGDDIADISSCTSWKQNDQDNAVCNSPADVVPGTTSKCHCDFVSTTEVKIEPDCVTDADCSDNNMCNGAEMCVEGVCEGGTPLVCDNGAYCDGSETCDPAVGCVPGTAPECGDGVECTVDSCNEATDSCDNLPNDNVCNDGAYCNGEEVCDVVNGCEAGSAPACDDGVSCTNDSCDEVNDSCSNLPDDSICNDGAYCNGVETCDAQNGCEAGAAVNCSDGVNCTVDACNEDTDSCDNAPNDGLCADGAFCNGDEVCDPTLGCQDGPDPNCADGVSCTVDTCNEGTDSCDHAPNDGLCADGNVCNGDETCDLANDCQPGTDEPPGTACGDQTDTACTNPDTCDGDGMCMNNNEVCGAVTNSALCEFDVELDKGQCVNGEGDVGEACSLSGEPGCPDGYSCQQSKEFRLGFNTDGNNKKAFRPPHSNPGQFYYNAFYDGNVSGGDGEVIAIVVPWPFITQGATPLHVYNGDDVGTVDTCFMPTVTLMNEKYLITLDDWIQPAGYTAPDWLSCDQVNDIGESGFCTLLIDIPEVVIEAVPSKLLYINLHLDYGLKGNFTDGLPPFGAADLYDFGASESPWGSRDALQDTPNANGPVAIQDCTDYNFSHYDESGLLFDDSTVNLNIFNIKSNGKK